MHRNERIVLSVSTGRQTDNLGRNALGEGFASVLPVMLLARCNNNALVECHNEEGSWCNYLHDVK